MKRGTIDHPKLLNLCALLNLRRYEAVGLLESIWHFTAKFVPQGDIGKYSNNAIAKAIDWNKSPDRLIEALCETGWLDQDASHRLLVHDWSDHMDQTTKRVLVNRKLAPYQYDASMELAPCLPESKNGKHETSLPLSGIHSRYPEPLSGIRSPEPVPRLAPPVTASEYPKAAAVIRSHYQTVDEPMVQSIVQSGIQAWLSVESPKIGTPDDGMIAEALKICWDETSNKQTSPALFRSTLPRLIKNWAQYGKENGHKPAWQIAEESGPDARKR